MNFDLQNLNRSSAELVNKPSKFHRDCSSYSRDIMTTIICPDEQTNAVDGQTENIMASPTMSGGKDRNIQLVKFEAQTTTS